MTYPFRTTMKSIQKSTRTSDPKELAALTLAQIPEAEYREVLLSMLTSEASSVISKTAMAKPASVVRTVAPVVALDGPEQPVEAVSPAALVLVPEEAPMSLRDDLTSRNVYVPPKGFVHFGAMAEKDWTLYTERRYRLSDAQVSAARWGELNRSLIRLHEVSSSGRLPLKVIEGLFRESNHAMLGRA